jgi:two-component system, NtrC family, nitrogen regulation sensor histidine kinase NtrY
VSGKRRDASPSTRPVHEAQIFRLALLAGLPAVVVAIALLWLDGHSAKVQWTLGGLVVATWLVTSFVLRERVVRPLQTLSNMLAALREGDYSIRARGAEREDALGLALLESNLLGETLRAQRLGAMEATALLRTVMAEIDVAVFAFDEQDRVRLVNRAGERLLGQPAEWLTGRSAEQAGLARFLARDAPRRVDVAFAGGTGRWEVRRGAFRQDGRPHRLLVLADVSKTLREEELQAWQRIVRVLSHEINNSLAPIRSLSGTLRERLRETPTPRSLDDLRRGLDVIGGRSESLVRFMSSYAQLARLPAPRRSRVDVSALVARVAALETRVSVVVEPSPPVTVSADPDQLEQLLINLVRNAADASMETGGSVRVLWCDEDGALDLSILDEGPGLASSANLFVPFFTTKPHGSGIGLVLCRQIAEAHGGSLSLENRTGERGCVARLRLPTA